MKDDDLESRVRETERYYELRARDYEALYYRSDPKRQAELKVLGDRLVESLRGRRVLEVAAGTGYWTQIVAEHAASVTAIDRSPTMLEEAKRKEYPRGNVRFEIGDAYDLAATEGDFDAAMVNFWISHVPRGRLGGFSDGLHRRLGPGAVVIMLDNINIPGQGGEFVSIAGVDDTFKLRDLADGSKHLVIKNYLERPELENLFAGHEDFEYHSGIYYWWLRYKVRA